MTLALVDKELVLERYDGSPIPLGLSIFHLLRTSYRMCVSSEDDAVGLERWFSVNGIAKDMVAYRFPRQVTEATMSAGDLFLRHLEMAQHAGPLEVVVTADPRRAADTVARGVNVLLFAAPATARPEYRPGLRGWADIEATITEHRMLKTEEPQQTED